MDGDIDFKPSQLLSSYISDWIDTYKTDVSRSTHVGYEMTLKAVSEYFENTSLDQVTVTMRKIFKRVGPLPLSCH
ncbi:hypothetical protein KQ236_16400 [Lactococcus lactis]|nr:hypothetical protein [Lactococcus lactis]